MTTPEPSCWGGSSACGAYLNQGTQRHTGEKRGEGGGGGAVWTRERSIPERCCQKVKRHGCPSIMQYSSYHTSSIAISGAKGLGVSENSMNHAPLLANTRCKADWRTDFPSCVPCVHPFWSLIAHPGLKTPCQTPPRPPGEVPAPHQASTVFPPT